jgi:CheY-like chemotaxis protein
MSHEIRTPLNSMMILAQMLAGNEDGRLSDRQQEWAATIHSAGQDLLALINQILDLSRVEAGRVETRLEPYPLAAIEDFVERNFRPVAMQRNLELSIEVVPGAPASLMTDRQLLDQVLKNLLANAFKFTERGSVKLRIERVSAGAPLRSGVLQRSPSVIAFSVTDTGVGIESAQMERIFEAFQQADASITRKYGGTGLGLTISREYARILGGEIDVQSRPNTGSTFTLYLPLAAEEAGALPALPPETPAAAAKAITPEAAWAMAGKKILVVEDDARNLYSVTSLLEHFKVRVVPANNARDAMARLREQADVDLILMDIMMPEIDGYQATREIRAMKGFGAIPIVALTAKASESDRAQCTAAGCTDYVVKPVDTGELVNVIVRNLRPH